MAREFSREISFDDIYASEYEKILYSIDKWYKLTSSDKRVLYFCKGEKDTSRDKAELLLSIFLGKYPKHDFSIVYLQTDDLREPSWNIPRLFNYYFPRFAPMTNAPDADIEAWDSLFSKFPLSEQALGKNLEINKNDFWAI